MTTEPLTALTFLSELYCEDAPGVLSLFLLPSRRTLWKPLTEVRALLYEAKPYIADHDVYFGIGLHEKIATDGRGEETDIIAIPGLWCDLDIADPVHRVKQLPPTIEDVERLLAQACPFPPSIVMHSGHGLQAYWLFRELWQLETSDERQKAKGLCQRLQQGVQAAAKAYGWHVDSTFDLTRVFRLPGTYNRKADPVAVTCLSWQPQQRYSPGEFDDILPALSSQSEYQPLLNGQKEDVPSLQTLQLSVRFKYLLRLGEDPYDPQRYPSRSEAIFAVMTALISAGYTDSQILGIMLDPTYTLSEKLRERGQRWFEQELARARSKYRPSSADTAAPRSHAPNAQSTKTLPSLEPMETLTDLLAAEIAPPLQLSKGLLHEGMLLFGGKSKRGKSWLMFDLAIALAVGRSAFRHYACPQPMPVLYLALEDGRARLQSRARAIQPNLTHASNFHLRYTFPPLADGGIEILAQEITTHRYGLVVIDVLARLEKAGIGKGEKNYHEVYNMFAPIQELRKEYPFCLAMLTHLRKQEAEDVFDALHGSVAYQGAQDVLWVLERKPKDDFAFLHIRDKDAEDQTIALRFIDGHWEYIGEGEEYEISRDQRKVIRILTEEKREMGVIDILRAGDFKQEQYGYLRKLLVMMVKEDLIHRTRHGKYSATLRGSIEMGEMDDPQDVDDDGNRVPF